MPSLIYTSLFQLLKRTLVIIATFCTSYVTLMTQMTVCS